MYITASYIRILLPRRFNSFTGVAREFRFTSHSNASTQKLLTLNHSSPVVYIPSASHPHLTFPNSFSPVSTNLQLYLEFNLSLSFNNNFLLNNINLCLLKKNSMFMMCILFFAYPPCRKMQTPLKKFRISRLHSLSIDTCAKAIMHSVDALLVGPD